MKTRIALSILAIIALTASTNKTKPTTEQVLKEALLASKNSKNCVTNTYRFKEVTDGDNCSFRLEIEANDSGEIVKTFQAKDNQDISKFELTYLTIETIGDDGPTEKSTSVKGTITHRVHGEYSVDIEKVVHLNK